MNNIKSELGLMHIYSGDGKGKTSACLGIVLRSIGCNLNVVFTQFLKDGESSELKVLKKFENVTIITGKEIKGFTSKMTKEELEIVKENNNNHLKKSIRLCEEGKCDLLVLDEIMSTVNYDLVDYKLLIDFLQNRPKNIEIVLSGRNPKDKLIKMADYVSEIKKIKHPYDRGVNARFGVEK